MAKIAFLGDIAFTGKYDLIENPLAKTQFEQIGKILATYDYVIGNLESPLTEVNKTLVCKSMHVKSNPINVELLKLLHIDAVCLANNHINDYGKKGIKDTIKILEENNIDWFGIKGKKIYKNFEGKDICFSGFCCYSANATNYGKNKVVPITYDNIVKQLKNDKENSRISIMSFHWGEEYTNYPKIDDIEFINEISKENSFYLIGHHAHIIQGMKKTKNSTVYYNLGNFCFGDLKSINGKMLLKQDWYNKLGLIVEMDVKKNNEIKTNSFLINQSNDNIELYKDDDLIKFNNDIIKNYKDSSYIIERSNQIKKNRAKKFGNKDIKWLFSKLNYYSIGAYILSKINSIRYKKTRFRR